MNLKREDIYRQVAAGKLTPAAATPMLLALRRGEDPVADRFPLTPAQRAIWTICRLEPETAAFNVPMAMELDAAVDIAVLRRACARMTERHSALRIRFEGPDEDPRQAVMSRVEPAFEEVELDDADLDEALRRAAKAPFDLSRAPLVRFALFRADGRRVLLVVAHHLVCDGASSALLARDLWACCAALEAGREPPSPPPQQAFAEFVRRQGEFLAGSEGARNRDYWLARLDGEPVALDLPLDRPRPPRPSYRGDTVPVALDQAETHALRRLARAEGVSLYVALLAVYTLLLHRYGGQTDIWLGAPVAGRPHTRYAATIGFFMNMTVIRADLSGDPPFRALLGQLRRTAREAIVHGDTPLLSVIEARNQAQGHSRTDLFQAAIYFQDFVKAKKGEDPPFRGLSHIRQEGEFELALEAVERQTGVELHFKYCPDLFDRDTIAHMAACFKRLASGVAEDASQPLSQCALIPDELAARVNAWNSPETEVPQQPTRALIAARAEVHPMRTAVVCDGRSLSYGALIAQAEAIAAMLRQRGVAPGDRVGVFMTRSTALPAALLGVWRAGAAYVPLDPDYPPERIAYMLADSGAALVLSQRGLRDRLPAVAVACVEDAAEANAGVEPPPAGLDALAYVIYTSGSTGKPKGVQISHRALVNFLDSMSRRPGFDEQDAMLAVTTICFDIAGLELFLPLVRGGRVELATAETARDGLALARLLAGSGATVMQATPATWRMLLAAEWTPSAKLAILCGGEALSPELAEALCAGGGPVWNLYGPTETTIWSTAARVESGAPVTVGRPIANTGAYVVDRAGFPAPPGAAGELWLGGEGLAWGYRDRPSLTAQRFLPDPFGDRPGGRVYRTGDWARWRANGALQHLGRNDGQVKLRGYRIELGEVESAVKKLAGVRDAVAVLRPLAGQTCLVAFALADREPARDGLASWLPEHMIPAQVIALREFPQTLNRKVDRKALAEWPLTELPVAPGQAARLESEPPPPDSDDRMRRLIAGDVAAAVAELAAVDRDRIRARTALRELGFDSLRFTALSVRLNKRFEVNVNPTLFYERTTVEAIAAFLAEREPQAMAARYGEALAATPAPEKPKPVVAAGRTEPNPGKGGSEPVAVVGMSLVAPRSPDLQSFWTNLTQGESLVGEVPEDRAEWRAFVERLTDDGDRAAASRGGFIDDVDKFDCLFFGISPGEAELIDPRQRLLLQIVWQALEEAGWRAADLAGRDVGFFAGVGGGDYAELVDRAGLSADARAMAGLSTAMLANRASHFFDWQGPSEPLDAACAGSLAAIARAVRAIQSGECETAVAAGVNLTLSPVVSVALGRAGMLSPSGACRPFDAQADGYVRGEGAGALVLKPLDRARADGDHVHGLILGAAVNHGGRANTLTAPNPNAQTALLVRAYQEAGVDPATVGYIEAAANGTELGDPVELNALNNAFGRLLGGAPDAPFCAVGSVKPYIGHLEAASGVVAAIKTLLSMKRGHIPANPHLHTANAYLNLKSSPFFLVGEAQTWPDRKGAGGASAPRRAGVNAFGFGGVNVHVILEGVDESPRPAATAAVRLLTLSAKTAEALRERVAALTAFLTDTSVNLDDLAYTLQLGREAMPLRLAGPFSDQADLAAKLEAWLAGNPADGWLSGDETPDRYAGVLDDDDLDMLIGAALTGRNLAKLARFWTAGAEVDWSVLHAGAERRRLSLPGYSFAKRVCWVGAGTEPVLSTAAPKPDPPALPEGGSPRATLRSALAAYLKLAPAELADHRDLADYGFDSYTGMQLANALRARYGVVLSPREMFDCPTFDALAQWLTVAVESGSTTPESVEDGAAARTDNGRFPLSEQQKALWSIQAREPESCAYNLPAAFALREEVDADALARALNQIVAGQSCLRTRFVADGEDLAQVVEAEVHLPLTRVDASALDWAGCEALAREKAREPFDLARCPLVRAYLMTRRPNEHLFLIVVHHIVFDGASFALLLNQLTERYAALAPVPAA